MRVRVPRVPSLQTGKLSACFCLSRQTSRPSEEAARKEIGGGVSGDIRGERSWSIGIERFLLHCSRELTNGVWCFFMWVKLTKQRRELLNEICIDTENFHGQSR